MIRLRDIPARLVVDRPDDAQHERPAHWLAFSAALLLASVLLLVVALVVAVH